MQGDGEPTLTGPVGSEHDDRVPSHPGSRWIEDAVDRTGEYLSIWHDDLPDGPVALVGPPSNSAFPVEFQAGSDASMAMLNAVRAEIDYFLVELGEPDPWAYACYHCTTFANAYPPLHWSAHLRQEDDADRLARVVDDVWGMFAQARQHADDWRLQVPSVPVLFFGNLVAYRRSPIRVVTVGLNPSHAELPVDRPWNRFPACEPLAQLDQLGTAEKDAYLDCLSAYFDEEPYTRWFDGGFEPILSGFDASYHRRAANTVLHTDIASPLATNETWSKLDGTVRARHKTGAEIWRRLMEILAPDVALVSVSPRYLSAIEGLSTAVDEWEELTRVERTNPYVVRQRTARLGPGKLALVVFGRCVNLPFGSVSKDDRRRIGEKIGERAAAMIAKRV